MKGAWRGKAAFIVLLPVLVIAALAGLFIMGQTILFPSTPVDGLGPKGRCFVLDRHWCSSLDVRYIERLAGFQLPPGADVIDSGSSRSLKSGREWATVRWPEGSPIPAPPRAVITVRGGAADSDFSRIVAEWHESDSDTPRTSS